MKTILKIFNLIIMLISLAATVLLFGTSTMSFNSNIAIDVATFSKFVPETSYSADINIPELLGTDAIHIGLKFDLNPFGVAKVMHGDRDKINEAFIEKNADDIITILHDPINLITEFSIRSVMKNTIKGEIANHIAEAAEAAGSSSTAEEIMDDVGMDDLYFTNFSKNLYNAANQDTATVDTVSDVLYEAIDDAMAKAEESGNVNSADFTAEKREEVKNSLLTIFDQLQLIEEDGVHLKKISDLPYMYLASFLKQAMDGKVDAAILEQGAEETRPDYSDRLLKVFVTTQMPDIVYQIIGYVCLALFIGLFVFAGMWMLLFVITLIKTFTKKPWTFFGPWFWLIGPIQIALGVGLTIAGKFVLPRIKINLPGFPIKNAILAPRTYALIPSLLFILMFVLAIAYAVIRGIAKRQAKKEAK